MKRFGIFAALCLMFLGFCGKASAQRFQDVPNLKGKVIYGGNFGFGMSGRHLSLSIAPQIGYRIFNPWEVGVRAIYDMTCDFNAYYGNSYGHYFGVAPYTNFQVFRGLFLHVEDEMMYGMTRYQHETVSRRWYNSAFVGGGYRQYASDGSYVYFLVLYNLSWGNISANGGLNTPYASPISIRVGYCF